MQHDYYTDDTQDSEAKVLTDRDTRMQARLTLLLVGSIVVIIGAVLFYVYGEKLPIPFMSSDESDQTTENPTEVFEKQVARGGNILRDQGTADAALYFEKLVESSATPEQEGRALLSLGFTRLGSNREDAVDMLKAVSVNPLYNPLTRAKATNYVLNEYTATKDEAFARKHIFVGPVWSEFAADSISEAVINGFVYSAELAPTPEANMRLAAEYAFQIAFGDLTVAEQNNQAKQVIEYIERGNEQIDTLLQTGEVAYGNTTHSEIAAALNRRSMAYDVLYFYGHIEDVNTVRDSFAETLAYIIDNSVEIDTGTQLFVRYHYADFLVRLNPEVEAANIEKILLPMRELDPYHNAATFFKSRVANTQMNDTKLPYDVARPDNIVRLASISEEFRTALIRVGVAAENLEA